MKFLRKFLSLTLENLNGKLIFWPFFLLFARVPEAVGAFYFSIFAVGGGDFSGRCGIQAGWGGESPPPRVKVWLTSIWTTFSPWFLQNFHRKSFKMRFIEGHGRVQKWVRGWVSSGGPKGHVSWLWCVFWLQFFVPYVLWCWGSTTRGFNGVGGKTPNPLLDM